MTSTLLDKLWAAHVILSEDGLDLLHVDRSLLTDLSGMIGLEEMEAEGLPVHSPALHVAIPDHVIATSHAGVAADPRRHARYVETLAVLAERAGVRHWARGSGRQGIVHVVGLERGLTLPGLTVVCGDSHTSTHGAVGALAFGIGSTEVKHVLATQTVWLRKPRQAQVRLTGRLPAGSDAKDLALWLIRSLGADYGREHAIEFCGPGVEALSVEGRATLCNLAVELGARFGLVAPDDAAFAYLRGRDFAPCGEGWARAVESWRTLTSDAGAAFDKRFEADVSDVPPQVTWGTSPEQGCDVAGLTPKAPPKAVSEYMDVGTGAPLEALTIDHVFIGSCANGRLEDLRAAAAVARGRRVAAGVRALVVPGSEAVKAAAEAEGLDAVFRDAGFEWRQPGCSMCVGVNGDVVPPQGRCVSTSNRNFVGRQGPGARTHLASPATAAASAIAGRIADPRPLLAGD